MEITVSIIITFGAVVGFLLTALTLPGMWIAAMVAAGAILFRPDAMGLSWLIAALLIAVVGEIAEFFASAAGAAQAKGSRAGVIGSILGGIVGAIGGTILLPFLPIIGTIAGAVIGAGGGAIVAERTHSKRSWHESIGVGKGAAVGRLLSVVVKTGIALIQSIVLIVGAWV